MTPTNHPLTETDAVELWDTHDPLTALRAAFDAGREHEREHAAPHHDARPWQDCTLEDIRKGDLVESRSYGGLRIGVAHHQDVRGNWHTVHDWQLTDGDYYWTLRRIPAPNTPAEEILLPTEHPAHITDAEGVDGDWLGVDHEGVLRAYRPKKTPNE